MQELLGLQRVVVIHPIPTDAEHTKSLLEAYSCEDEVADVEQQVLDRLGCVSPLLTRLPLPLKSEAAGSLEPTGGQR